MGWTVELRCRCCDRPVSVDRHTEGGNYAIGGTTDASLSVTYNYGGIFRSVFLEGFQETLEGRTAVDAIPLLERGVDMLQGARSYYWDATDGNAGHVLGVLLGWARDHPDAVFRVE